MALLNYGIGIFVLNISRKKEEIVRFVFINQLEKTMERNDPPHKILENIGWISLSIKLIAEYDNEKSVQL
ncbi:hypothetical protein BpHYR1_048218 [Brachionus plicatilis]|uniref:Uncharacterized protein n=1 Tax=Brachionus plicatilis TaxID=10195 RepID=A0A3M7RYW9_BRAPC|nr:hypothetical protein BpHYR1_048218 [Brachionus plicatilis]